MLQAGTRRRVQHGDVSLEHPPSSSHLVLVMDIFKFLAKYNEKKYTEKAE